MASQQSESYPYKSRFSTEPLWVTPQAYLAENMVARQCRKAGSEPPLKFWNQPRWKREFAVQVQLALSLLKIYCPEAIILALRTPQGKKIYSFGAKWLDPLVKAEQDKIDRRQAELAAKPVELPPTEIAVPEALRPPFVHKKNAIAKLQDI